MVLHTNWVVGKEIKIILSLNENLSIDEVWDKVYKLAEEKGKGDILWPLRYSLSGKEKSPDPKTLISILGIKESAARIESALSELLK